MQNQRLELNVNIKHQGELEKFTLNAPHFSEAC